MLTAARMQYFYGPFHAVSASEYRYGFAIESNSRLSIEQMRSIEATAAAIPSFIRSEYLHPFILWRSESEYNLMVASPGYERTVFGQDLPKPLNGEVGAITGLPQLKENDSFPVQLEDGSRFTVRIVKKIPFGQYTPIFDRFTTVAKADTIFGLNENSVVLMDDGSLAERYPDRMFPAKTVVALFSQDVDSYFPTLQEQFSDFGYTFKLSEMRDNAKQDFDEEVRKFVPFPAIFYIVTTMSMLSIAILSAYKNSVNINVLRINGLSRKRTLFLLQAPFLLISVLSALGGVAMGLIMEYSTVADPSGRPQFIYHMADIKYFLLLLILLNTVIYLLTSLMLSINEKGEALRG